MKKPEPRVYNLHVTVRCPQSPRPPLAERVEEKFFVAPKRMDSALALLLRTCRADPLYPIGQVNSLYFDTADLDLREQSASGLLVKDKVRIRWYGEEYDPHPPPADDSAPQPDVADGVTVWLELKSRRGFAATKQRLPTSVSSGELAFPVLGRGIVPASMLHQVIAGFGFFPTGPIRPVIVISYFRRRFVDPVTGHRISLDSHIRSSLVPAGAGRGQRALELPGGVVEVKCPVLHLPPALRGLAAIGSYWSRYSKYAACLESHEATQGTVSRLWPSGLMEEEPGALARVQGKAQQGRQTGKQETVTPETEKPEAENSEV
jgi:hypothetical protein